MDPKQGVQAQIDPEDAPLFESLISLGQMIAAGKRMYGEGFTRQAVTILADATGQIGQLIRRSREYKKVGIHAA